MRRPLGRPPLASVACVWSTGSHVVASDGERSSITLTLDQEGPLGRLIGLVASGLTKRYVSMEANGLERRSEQEAGGSIS